MNPLVHIFFLHQPSQLDKDSYDHLLEQLPVSMQEEISSFKKWQHAQGTLLSKLLLKHAFKELQTNISFDDWQLGDKDRPHIKGAHDFNISHSGEYSMVSVFKNAKTGIDIELHRKLDPTLFKKYFSEFEWKLLESDQNPSKIFFDLWSIKESAIKCDGRGVEILSKTFVDETFDPSSKEHQKIICDSSTFYFRKLEIDNTYSSAVCCTEPFDIKLHKVATENL